MIQGYLTDNGIVFIAPFNLVTGGHIAAHQGEMVLVEDHILQNLTRANHTKVRHKYDLRLGMSCEHPTIQ